MAGQELMGEVQRRAAVAIQQRFNEVVTHGVGPLPGSVAFAEDRLRRARRPGRSEEQAREVAIRRIVTESVSEAGGAGFVTGLGGLITMPVTVPADLAGNFVINARMVGAIAHLRGYSLNDPLVQTMMQFVVAGVGIEKMATEFGIKVGEQVIEKAIIKGTWCVVEGAIPMIVIDKVGARAGYALVIRFGATRTATVLSKAVPLLGGLVGGAVDSSFTRATAALARKAFPGKI